MESPRIVLPNKESLLAYLRRRAFLLEMLSLLLALLFGQVELFGRLLPFGIAFLSAMDMAGRNAWYPMIGALLGALIAGPAGGAAAAGCGLYMGMRIVYKLVRKRARRVDKLFLLGASQILILPLFFMGSFEIILQGLAGFALTILLATVYQNALRALNGIENRSRLHDEEQVALCLLVGGLALAIAGISAFAFSLGVMLVVWVAMFLAYAKGLPAVAAAVTLAGMLVLGGRAQPMLLADIALCTLAGVICRRMQTWGVAAGFVICCAITERYFGINGQYVGLINAIPAALMFVMIPKRAILWLKAKVDAGAKEERTARAILKRMQVRAAEDIAAAAGTVERMARLFPSQPGWNHDQALERDEIHRAAYHVCADCTHRGACWREEDEAIAAVEGMLPTYAAGMRPRPQAPLRGDCTRAASIAAAAFQAKDAYRKSCMQVYRADSQRAFAHRQLNGISRVIQSLSEELRESAWPDEMSAQLLKRRLERRGIRVNNAVVQKGRGGIAAELLLPQCKIDDAEMEDAVSSAMERPMRLLGKRAAQKSWMLQFEQARKLRAGLGAATKPMQGSLVSGDSTGYCNLPGGRAIFALSDGMGSGRAARAQSLEAVQLLLRLYEVGFERDPALECMNRLLMGQGEQDMYATVDALYTDLNTGNVEFIKFGAPPSFVLREGRVHTVYAEALPAGILDEAYPAVHTATLKRNDVVVLLTDGALDALGEDTEQEIIRCVGGANSCEEAARALLGAAQERSAGDDMSVMVVRME